MVNRIAGILALIAFAMTALVGSFEAGNSFASSIGQALIAMLATYVVGYLIGMMAERMLGENLAAVEQRLSAARDAQEEPESEATAQAQATDGR